MMTVLILFVLLGAIIAGWRGYVHINEQLSALQDDARVSVSIQRRREQAVEHLKTSEGRELLRARLRQRLETVHEKAAE